MEWPAPAAEIRQRSSRDRERAAEEGERGEGRDGAELAVRIQRRCLLWIARRGKDVRIPSAMARWENPHPWHHGLSIDKDKKSQ